MVFFKIGCITRIGSTLELWSPVGSILLTSSRVVIFGCRYVSMWIQTPCCSSVEGRAGLTEQQYNLLVVQKISFLFLPFPTISCIGLALGCWCFFFYFPCRSAMKQRQQDVMFFVRHCLSPRRSVLSPAVCLLPSPWASSATARGELGLGHLAAGWLYPCPPSALHKAFCAQQLLAARCSSALDFQLIRRC